MQIALGPELSDWGVPLDSSNVIQFLVSIKAGSSANTSESVFVKWRLSVDCCWVGGRIPLTGNFEWNQDGEMISTVSVYILKEKRRGGVWYYQNVFLSWVGSDNDAYVFLLECQNVRGLFKKNLWSIVEILEIFSFVFSFDVFLFWGCSDVLLATEFF